jgi:hypothetical protein
MILIVLALLFVLALVGSGFCLGFRATLIRAAETRHALASALDAVAGARESLVALQRSASERDGAVKQQRRRLAEIDAELKTAQQQLNRLPVQAIEVVFELGAPDPGLKAHEFIIARRRAQRPGELNGPETELWAQPRTLRTWSRNQATAMAIAQNRFPSTDGFLVRAAERLGQPAGASAARP